MTVLEDRPRERTPPARARPGRDRRRRPPVDLYLAAAVSAVVATLVAWGIDRYPGVGGDEGIYAEQAWATLHGRITPYTYTYDHPFLGWLQIAVPSSIAQRLHLGGALSVVNDRAVMVGYAFAATMLVFGIARRLGMGRVTAVVAVAATGLSPLYVVEARQVLLDNIAVPWALLALFQVLSPHRRQWTHGLAGVALAIGVLSKETVVLLLPAVLYALWTHCRPPLRAMAVTVFGGLFVLTCSVHLLFALLRNELFPGSRHVSIWTNEIEYQLFSRSGSGALWQAGSGRRLLLDSWTSYDPWLLYAGAVAAVACLAIRRLRVVGLGLCLWSLPLVKPGGYLPSMYVVAALPFAGLALAGVTDAVFGWVRRRGAGRAAAVALVAAVSLPLSLPLARAYVHGEAPVQDTDVVANDRAALTYVEAHVSRRARVLTDDAFWVDLTRAGFSHDGWDGPVAYYKFDLDPVSAAMHLPQGWKDLNFILSTNEMRSFAVGNPMTRSALAHATVVRTFGSGGQRVVLYRVRSTAHNAARFAGSTAARSPGSSPTTPAAAGPVTPTPSPSAPAPVITPSVHAIFPEGRSATPAAGR